MAKVKLIDVCKVYKGNVKAVKDFNLEIKDGEFLVFVGPSGCGKSTTLRMVAGLEDITSGKIYIDDKFINDLEPKDRDIAMVFQNYALYPHMSVYDNLAYSLNCHHVDKNIIKEKVEEVAKMLDIEEYLLRKPKELSGGQRQRVALGRCLIRSPKVFLFDEPLSNLDAKLRVSMRSEISKLHKKVNGTFIYVTHDQTEAMTMGDRIVVMKDGLIQQVDTPVNLYEHPVNVFVATFLGSPQMNIFTGSLDGNVITLGEKTRIELSEKTMDKMISGYDKKEVYLGIRPSDFILGSENDYDIHVPQIELIEKLGNETLIYFKMEGRKDVTLASLKLNITDELSEEVYLKIDKEKVHIFNDKEESILRTNDINYVKANIDVVEEDALINNKYVMKNFLGKCVRNCETNKFPGYISMPSKDFSLERKSSHDIELEVLIRAIDVFSDKKVYYSSIVGEEDTRVTFFGDKQSKICKNEIVKIYMDINNVDIYDNYYNRLTVEECLEKPLQEVELTKIVKDFYIKSNSKDFCKNKYFVIEKIYDLNNEMIISVKNEKNKKYSFLINKNPDVYVGMILYLKYVKK